MKPSPLLEIKDLVTEFNTDDRCFKAVNNINLTINKGEVAGLVGESGAGKSTVALSILKLINSPDKITSGKLIYHTGSQSVDLIDLNEKELCDYRGKEIAMIFQDPRSSLNPVYTCGHQVAETLILHEKCSYKVAKQKTIELFKEVNLSETERIFSAYPHQLSGGQLQRVMIAMAISCHPSLLIADEPTSALDTQNERIVLNILKKLNKEKGMAILLITHALPIITELTDRIAVMYKGQIVEEGDREALFSNPQHIYTKELLASRLPDNKREKHLSKPGLNQPLLKLIGLKKYFPVQKNIFSLTKTYVKAVNGISFEIHPGETLGLVGDSGCGKTTLSRTLLKLIEPTAGNIFFKGKDISAYTVRELQPLRRQMQLIFQNPYMALNPKITIGEAIAEPMRIHKLYLNESKRKEKTIELLEKVNLHSSHLNRYPHEFSGGERQRICIARALALNPELIICDEAVSSLDTINQLQVLNLLLQLQKEFNLAYLFISHNISVVNYMSDRVIKMENGKLNEMLNVLIDLHSFTILSR